ncbi:NAD(+)/NADH kinase [Subdoligranulum variabile]|uniref:NAD kinase n=1 Tax=Subdoligranulum variabile DSM 15176 TaxID=411471 RepID=D1PKV2_9FIRM|nr:NAD(+)/NADH kinase [Subdoligranulum variabile]EFB76610.1 NAD(+)/NADH kinase [Subdoligranulum variabile DSM 15176]UWP68158.1 NAD(+)/NADH kinase [Subdoligranulum variabile]
MAVLLIPNVTKDQGLAITKQAADLLLQYGQSVLLTDQVNVPEFFPQVTVLPEPQAYQRADAVLTIGGDGTLLRSGHACVHYRKPVLGVNLGRTGFLATCEVEEMPEKLRRLADGEYMLAKRGLLSAEIPQADWQRKAINDLVVFGETRMHPMDYSVYCDGSFVSSYRSDGLIVATPTGSTAYSFSAGGPVLDGMADVMVLTPVCAHNVHTAPLVFAANRTLEIVADAENRDVCYACADSGPRHALLPGQKISITAAPGKLQLITFEESEQFCAIENKLMRR